MIHDAPNINHLWSRLTVEELRRNGVDTFYISPGSRSTPLTVAAAQTAGVQTYVHFDERGAAFAAMGHAMGSERPTALICTSGSAAANYLPAIVEASQSGTPLIVLTADRPPELTDAGANQAIDQTGLYRNFVRWEHALPCPTKEMPAQAVLTAIDQAVFRSNGNDPGPVHINCPFREPLAPTNTGDDWTEYLVPLEPWLGSDTPYTRYADVERSLPHDDLERLEKVLDEAERGLLIIGRLNRNSDRIAAVRIAATLRWPIFADTTSFPLPSDPPAMHVEDYDLLLASKRFADILRPDTVLHLGGPFVSKRLLMHLDSVRPTHYVRTIGHGRRDDPMHLCTLRVPLSVRVLEKQLGSSRAVKALGARNCKVDTRPDRKWMDLFNDPIRRFHALTTSEQWPLRGETINEPFLLHCLQALNGGDDRALFLGNSMPVRDADMFFSPLAGQGGAIVVNRGASGIDGNIATAAGFARATGRRMTIVLGDLAALHDLNSLAMLRDVDPPMTLVVINNDGGGIFNFLPVAESFDKFEMYFGTPHGLTFEKVAAMFNLEYESPVEMTAFVKACGRAERSGKSAIIEVRTDREENVRLHQEILRRVREAIDG